MCVYMCVCTHRKAAITTRMLGLVHQLCTKRIHVTKRDLFYTDVKLFVVSTHTHTHARARAQWHVRARAGAVCSVASCVRM